MSLPRIAVRAFAQAVMSGNVRAGSLAGRAVLFLLVLTGCTSVPEAPPDTDFQVRGKLAVRGGSRPFSARFHWFQQASAFDVELWGPFGQGRRRLKGRDDQLEILDGSGALLQAGPADPVMIANLGFTLPLDALRFWIQGRPAPTLPVGGLQRDATGRLDGFEQAAWQIEYPSWVAFEAEQRPERITARGEGYELRLALNWPL